MVEYESDRLYGARRTFGASSRAEGFLFGVRPDVWPLDAPILPLVLPDLPNLGPPPNLRSSRPQAQNQTIFYGTQPLKTYNPSLAAAPRGLCPRCAFVLALRVDGLHQCSSSTTPYRSEQTLAETDWFQGTAIAVLDASLAILGWTWLVNSPPYQIATKGANPAAVRAARCMQHGASDHSFLPSWAKQTFDARIFNVAGGLVVTYACPACLFSLSPLRFSAQPTADGGVSQLRAWAPHRITYPSVKWTNGRNQVLFTYRPPPRPSAARNVSSGAAGAAEERDVRERLMIQPRLGMIGSLGRPRFAVHGRRVCRTHVPRNPTRPFPPVPSAANCHGDFGRDPDCGTFPDGSTIDVVRFEGVWEKRAKLRNDSRAHVEASLRASGLYGGLSLTSNLVKVRWREAGADGGGGGASGGGAGGGGWFGGACFAAAVRAGAPRRPTARAPGARCCSASGTCTAARARATASSTGAGPTAPHRGSRRSRACAGGSPLPLATVTRTFGTCSRRGIPLRCSARAASSASRARRTRPTARASSSSRRSPTRPPRPWPRTCRARPPAHVRSDRFANEACGTSAHKARRRRSRAARR